MKICSVVDELNAVGRTDMKLLVAFHNFGLSELPFRIKQNVLFLRGPKFVYRPAHIV